ncbi:hypothetical protein ACLIMP_22835 [Novosphingobium aerophilum]|uniref:hypothetical protein n=1 Tax=Novosphingobium aerophilum TaxID=2839843 RepID=UPI00163D8607
MIPEPSLVVQITRALPEAMIGKVSRIRRHRAPDNVGAADLVVAGEVSALTHTGKKRRKIVKPLGYGMNDLALLLHLHALA